LLLLLIPFLRLVPGHNVKLQLAGFAQGVVQFGLMFTGLALSHDVSSVAIAVQLYVPFTALLAWWFLGETIGWRRSLGIALAVAGVIFMGFDPMVLAHIEALALVATAALAMAVSSIWIRQMHGAVHPLNLQAWVALWATPFMGLFTWLFEPPPWTLLAESDWFDYSLPLYSALGASLVGHGLLTWLLGRHPVSLITPFLLLTPVLAVAFGVLVWGDELTVQLVGGGLVTLGGLALLTVSPNLWRRWRRHPTG
ncbi:MAG: DMT family transporter, partial [Candidatus Competibacterales bacterium]